MSHLNFVRFFVNKFLSFLVNEQVVENLATFVEEN